MKKEYLGLEIQIFLFREEDIVTLSPNQKDGLGDDFFDD